MCRAGAFHRRFHQPWNDALHDGAGERLVDGVGQDPRFQGLHEHQRQPDHHVVRLLPPVLDAVRTTSDPDRCVESATGDVSHLGFLFSNV